MAAIISVIVGSLVIVAIVVVAGIALVALLHVVGVVFLEGAIREAVGFVGKLFENPLIGA